jgi:anti-anti-sigma regulatory factor
MPWRRSRRPHDAAARPLDPVVLTVTYPLTHQTAEELAAQVGRIPAATPVVVDLTAIPSFDTDGADMLLGLQDSIGADRLSIVGFRQAVSRLVGGDDLAVESPVIGASGADDDGWRLRRLRNLAVVQAAEGVTVSTAALEQAVTAAIAEDVAIVVLDLRPVLTLTAESVQIIAFASSSAALRGQELLVVNVSAEAGEQLRRAGLSATTFVAPEPLLDDPY